MTGNTENPAAMTESTMLYTLLSPYGRICSQAGFFRALVPLAARVIAAQIMAKLVSIEVAKKESSVPRKASMAHWLSPGPGLPGEAGAPSWDSSRSGRPRCFGSLVVRKFRVKAAVKTTR